MTKKERAFPNQKDIQIAYGLENVNPEEGRRTFDVCYELEKVFDIKNYKNGKKFKKHVRQYLDFFKENNFVIRPCKSSEDIAKVYELWKEWNDAKLEADRLNPNHFAQHSERYKHCLDVAFEEGKLVNGGVLGMFDASNNLLSYQMYVIVDDWFYGLTTACTKKTEYDHLANVATISYLNYIFQNGSKFANWGECGGDPKLLEYKEAFPNFRIYYGKLNVDFIKSEEKDVDEIVAFMQKYSTPEIPFPTEYMPETIKAGNVLKAIVDEKLVGIVECRNKDRKNLMTNLIVSEEFRCQGIAQKLLEQLPKPFYFNCYKVNERANNFYRGLKNVECTGESANVVGESWDYIFK